MNKTIFVAALVAFSPLMSAQTCVTYMEKDAPFSRFEVPGQGIVIDTRTDLMWMRCSIGQAWDSGVCVGSTELFDWKEGLETAESTTFAGFNNWRLPNLKELASLKESACLEPSVNESVFKGVASADYWTSTPSAISGDSAWTMSFVLGQWTQKAKNQTAHLLLVRDTE